MKDGAVRINLANIYYIESQGYTMVFHTIFGNFETAGTMKSMEDLTKY